MGSAWRAHAARTKRTDGLVDRRDDEVKRATSYRCHISRSPRSQESERQPVAEVMTRSATGGRRLPSYEARTYGRRDAFSGRRCAAKAGWTGAAAPVQSAERAPRPPSPQINLRLPPFKAESAEREPEAPQGTLVSIDADLSTRRGQQSAPMHHGSARPKPALRPGV